MFAFVRNSSNLEVLANLPITILNGDVLDSSTLDQAMLHNIEVVISAFGGNGNSEHVIEKGMLNIVNAMIKHRINNLIAVGGAGILRDPVHGLQLFSPQFPSFLLPIAEQHLKAWEYVNGSGINYMYLCPPRMVEGSIDDDFETSPDFPIALMAGKVAYESCAKYIIDVLTNATYNNNRISINQKQNKK